MKDYIEDIIPRIQRFSKSLDNITLLSKQHWVKIEEVSTTKSVYIFQKNGFLIISINGKACKAKWECLGFNSILIEKESESLFFKHGFFDENILALKIDNSTDNLLLVNEFLYESGINSLKSVNEFMLKKYFDSNIETSSIAKQASRNSNLEQIKPDTFPKKLEDGTVINVERIYFDYLKEGAKVFDTVFNELKDGKYKIKSGTTIYVLNSKIREIFTEREYEIRGVGTLIIEQQDVNGPSIGDTVTMRNNFASDDGFIDNGEFRTSWIEKIYVLNSKIVKRTVFGM